METVSLTRERGQPLADGRHSRREYSTQIGDYGERERDPDESEHHAERPSAGRYWHNVSVS